MTLTVSDWIFALGLPVLLGIGGLRAIGITFREDRLGFLAWSWLVGSLGTAAIVFLWLWFEPRTDSALVPELTVFAVAIALLGLAARRPRRPLPTSRPRQAPSWERACFYVLLILALSVVAVRIQGSWVRAIVRSDEAIFWAHRAKILFHSGGFTQEYFAALGGGELPNKDYPVLNPLLHSWIFAHAERVTHVANRVPLQLFSISLVLALASAARRVVRPAVAGVLVILCVNTEPARFAALYAYSDVIVALSALVAFDAWLRWRADGERSRLRLMALAVAALLWSKNDGSLFLAGAVVAGLAALITAGSRRPAFWARMREASKVWPWLSAPLLVLAVNWAFNATLGTPEMLADWERRGSFGERWLERMPEAASVITSHLARDVVFSPANSQLAWLLFALFLLFGARELSAKSLLAPALVPLVVFVGLAVLIPGLPGEPEWYMRTAAPRVLFQAVPLILLWSAAAAGTLFPRLRWNALAAS